MLPARMRRLLRLVSQRGGLIEEYCSLGTRLVWYELDCACGESFEDCSLFNVCLVDDAVVGVYWPVFQLELEVGAV